MYGQHPSQSGKPESNPFVDAFKQISEGDGMKDLFEGLGDLMKGTDMNFGGGDDGMKQMSDLMSVLNTINQNDSSPESDDKITKQMFEQLFDMFIKEDVLSVPMAAIRTKLLAYMEQHKELTNEEKSKYNQIIGYIDEMLVEIKKPQPNKEMVIGLFEKLHSIGELPQEIMNESNSDLLNIFKK